MVVLVVKKYLLATIATIINMIKLTIHKWLLSMSHFYIIPLRLRPS